MPRNNILLRRLTNSRCVQLPNGRVFFAKYKRVNRHALAPTQVRIANTYLQKLGPRKKELDGMVQEIKDRKDNRLLVASTWLQQ